MFPSFLDGISKLNFYAIQIKFYWFEIIKSLNSNYEHVIIKLWTCYNSNYEHVIIWYQEQKCQMLTLHWTLSKFKIIRKELHTWALDLKLYYISKPSFLLLFIVLSFLLEYNPGRIYISGCILIKFCILFSDRHCHAE